MSKIIAKIKRIGVFDTFRGLRRHQYYKTLQTEYHFDNWHLSPIEWRPYARDIVKEVNHLKPVSVYEVGCGLGDILRKIHAKTRGGYDLSESAIKCAKYLDQKSEVKCETGTFDKIINQKIDCFISVNFIHEISSDDLKQIFASLIKQNEIHYIVVDSVTGGGYKYHHDYAAILPEEYQLMKKLGPYRTEENDSKRYVMIFEKTQV